MSNQLTVSVVLKLIDQMSGQMRGMLAESEKRLDSFGQKAQAIGGKFESVGLRVGGMGVAANAALGKANLSVGDVINSAIDTEQALYQLANTAGISGAAAKRMVDQWESEIGRLAKATNQNKSEIIIALQDLVSRGLDPDKAIAMLDPVGRAATATGAGISDMAKSAFSSYDNLKIPVDALGQSLDIMAKAGNEGAFELRDMAQHFPQLTAMSRLLGMEGTRGLASIAASAQIAMKGAGDTSTAANNLSNFLAKLSSPDTVKHFDEFGVNLAEETKKGLESGDLIGYMARLVQRISGGDAQIVSELFRDLQAKNFISPLIQNLDEYERIRNAALTGSAGVVDTQFDTAMQATAAKLKATQINVQGTVDQSTALDSFISKLNGISEWANAHPDLAGWLGMAAVGAAAGGLIIGGAATAIGATVTAIGTLLPALGAVAGWLAANPVVLSLLGLGASAVAGWKFGTFLNEQINEAVASLTGEKGATLGGKLFDWIEGPNGLIPKMKALPGTIKATAKEWVQAGRDIINGLWQGIKAEIAKPVQAIKDLAHDLPDWAKKILGIKSPSRVFMGIGENIGQGMALGIEKSIPAVSDAANQLLETVNVSPNGQPRNADGSFKSSVDAAAQGSGALGGMREYVASVQSAADQTKNMMVRAWQGAEDALTQFVKTGKWDFRSLADSIISDLARMASNQFTSGVAGLFGGGSSGSAGGGWDNIISTALNFIFSAKGNAFAGGRVVPFAKGGIPSLASMSSSIVTGPTMFGVAGEEPGRPGEAIMPLARMSNGRLGVQSAGAGGGTSVQVNVINNADGTKATATERQDGNGNSIIDVMIEKVKGSIASDISAGRGAIPGALAGTYGLNRVAGAY